MRKSDGGRGGRLRRFGGFLMALLWATPAAGQFPPAERPPDALVDLGRLLFWDPILSGEMDVSCATCHHPDFAYADGRALSLGPRAVGLGPERVDLSGGEIPGVRRNAHTVLNTVFNGLRNRGGRGGRRGGGGAGGGGPVLRPDQAPMFWDNRVRSLEAQALEPIKAFEEMRGGAYPEDVAVDSVVARLRAIPGYRTGFADAFGSDGVDDIRLASALAAFQRSLVAVNSPFDRFRAGDPAAMTAEQVRGLSAFNAVGCGRCHGGPMFSDFQLHAEGVGEHPLLAEPDSGDGRFRFRTPTLRNVALTAPYMHNGVLETLEDVVRFYDAGVSANPNVVQGGGRGGGGQGAGGRGGGAIAGGVLSRNFRRVADMTDAQISDIVAFLHALTDGDFDRRIPDRVPSGLPVGGRIGTPTGAEPPPRGL